MDVGVVILVTAGAIGLSIPAIYLVHLWRRKGAYGCTFCAYDLRDTGGRCISCRRMSTRERGFDILPPPSSNQR